MGGHRSRVYPRSASNVRKSGKPDVRCSRRRARGCGMPGRPKIAAPHHEAERGRECIKLIGIRSIVAVQKSASFFAAQSEIRSSEPKPHKINKFLVSLDSEISKRMICK